MHLFFFIGPDHFRLIHHCIALSLLVPGSGDREDRNLQQVLANLQESCGGTAALQPLKTAFQLGDEVVNDSWPEQITVQCF